MHLNVGDPVAWYAKLYPDVPFGSLVPGVCYDCFHDLSAGDLVQLRHVDDELADRTGVIARIATDPKGSGSIYFVTIDDKERVFIRRQLRKHRDENGDTEPNPELG